MKHIGATTGLLLLLLVVNWPVLTSDFAHHDQYRYFIEEKSTCRNDPQFYPVIHVVGRPITAFIECGIFKNVRDFSDIRPFRAITVLLLYVTGLILYFIFSRTGLSRVMSFTLSSLIVFLPGFLNNVAMNFLASVIAVDLALAAYLIVAGCPPGEMKPVALLRNLTAGSLLFVGFLIYPVMTLFFFVPFPALARQRKSSGLAMVWKMFIRSFVIFIITAVIYIIGSRIFLSSFYTLQLAGASRTFWEMISGAPNTRALSKISEAWSLGLNFWNIYPNAVISAAAVLSLFLAALKFRSCPRVLLIFLATLFLTGGIYAVIPFETALHRFLMPLSSAVLVIIACVVESSAAPRQPALITAGTLLVAAVMLGHVNIRDVVRNSQLEYEAVRKALHHSGSSQLNEEFFTGRDLFLGFNGKPCVVDAFNCNTTSLSSNRKYIVSKALRDNKSSM